MKKLIIHIERWTGSMLVLLLMVSMLMVVACSEETDEPQGSTLQLSSVTRASIFTPVEGSNIKMYVMAKDAQYSEGNFSGATWTNSNVKVKEHEQYYLYGFMPGSYGSSISATASDLSGDYSKGADLTINGLPIFTDRDICAIVGVGRVTSSGDETIAMEGNYGYLSGLNNDNYVNLLMDHLYSKLILQMNVDANYSLLRNIKLKSVTMTCIYGQSVDVKVKLRAGYGLQGNANAFTPNSSGSSQVHTLWTSTDAEGTLIPSDANETPLSLGSVNCPPVVLDAAGTYMNITCTYDVYDKDGHKMRECTVENKLKTANVNYGVEYTLTLTVAPTYIYMLSDDDLNNPTIKVN